MSQDTRAVAAPIAARKRKNMAKPRPSARCTSVMPASSIDSPYRPYPPHITVNTMPPQKANCAEIFKRVLA